MTKIFNKQETKFKRKILRNNMPNAEKVLWMHLKNKQLKGYKFRRQYSVDQYVIDFYCPKLKLAIEVDGDSHFTKDAQEYDRMREKQIESVGIKILRYSNLDVYNNLEGYCKQSLKKPPLTKEENKNNLLIEGAVLPLTKGELEGVCS